MQFHSSVSFDISQKHVAYNTYSVYIIYTLLPQVASRYLSLSCL